MNIHLPPDVTVESREDSVRLTNLKPSTEYSVHVMASSIAGSSKSSSANFKTKQFGIVLFFFFFFF